MILSNGVITQPLTAQNVQVAAILFCSLTTYIIYFGKTMNYAISEVVFGEVKYDKDIVTDSTNQAVSKIMSGKSQVNTKDSSQIVNSKATNH